MRAGIRLAFLTSFILSSPVDAAEVTSRMVVSPSITLAAGMMKGDDGWSLKNYVYPSIRFIMYRSVSGTSGGGRKLLIESVALEGTWAAISGTHREHPTVDMRAVVHGMSLIFYSGYLRGDISEKMSLIAGPGFSICAIAAQYSGLLLYSCGIKEKPGSQFFMGFPLFADVNLRHRVSDKFRLTYQARIGLATTGGPFLGQATCGLREEDFPCINTGINLGISAEWNF